MTSLRSSPARSIRSPKRRARAVIWRFAAGAVAGIFGSAMHAITPSWAVPKDDQAARRRDASAHHLTPNTPNADHMKPALYAPAAKCVRSYQIGSAAARVGIASLGRA